MHARAGTTFDGSRFSEAIAASVAAAAAASPGAAGSLAAVTRSATSAVRAEASSTPYGRGRTSLNE